MQLPTKGKLLLATYLMTILYALHYGMPLFASSSFLRIYFDAKYFGVLYMLGSALTLFASLRFTKYLRKYHTYRFIFAIVLSNIIVTMGLGFATSKFLIGALFITHFCFQALTLVFLNIFLETFTDHKETGMVRGIFLTLLNLGILIAPFLGGAVLSLDGFRSLYLIAGLMLVPFLFFLHLFMRDVPDPAYHTIDVPHALLRAWHNKNLRGAFVSVFLLECFYATMVIYFPIYITNIGVPLIVYMTAIIPIALTPFVIMPYELGIIADKKLGEKELLVTGLLITATSVLIISVLQTTSTLVWILVLLLSRIGAACVETMAYTYFYKKINPEDSSLMAAFTNMRSTAIIVVTVISTILGPVVLYYPSVLFILLALALLYGVIYVIPIKDTR